MSTCMEDVPPQFREGFKYFNQLVVAMWKLGLGKWINILPDVLGRTMVLTHSGRKSGQAYQTPVNYAVADGDVFCVARHGRQTDWLRNVQANPQVQVWLPNGWWAGTAEEVTDDNVRIPLLRQVLINGGWLTPMTGIYPNTMTDRELLAAAGDTPVIRIRRTEARTGENGPAEYAWLWPLASLLLVLLLLRRRCKR